MTALSRPPPRTQPLCSPRTRAQHGSRSRRLRPFPARGSAKSHLPAPSRSGCVFRPRRQFPRRLRSRQAVWGKSSGRGSAARPQHRPLRAQGNARRPPARAATRRAGSSGTAPPTASGERSLLSQRRRAARLIMFYPFHTLLLGCLYLLSR